MGIFKQSTSASKFYFKGNSGIFKPGPYIYLFWCVSDSHLAKVSESVQ